MPAKQPPGANASTVPLVFLTWHRMFIWYFERVLQAAAGDPSLRLPFWDYATDPNLPAAYRDPTYVNEAGQTVPNPLRVNARQPSLNDGSAGLAAAVRSAAGAMEETTFGSFSFLLERTPHGVVHGAVGVMGNGLMGTVPSLGAGPRSFGASRQHRPAVRLLAQGRRTGAGCQATQRISTRNSPSSMPMAARRAGVWATCFALRSSAIAMHKAAIVQRWPWRAQQEEVRSDCISEWAGLRARRGTRLQRGVTTVPISVPPTAREMLSARAPSAGAASMSSSKASSTTSGRERSTMSISRVTAIGASRSGSSTSLTSRHLGACGSDSSAGRFGSTLPTQCSSWRSATAAQPLLVFEPTTGLTNSSPEAAAERISPQANVRFDSAADRDRVSITAKGYLV